MNNKKTLAIEKLFSRNFEILTGKSSENLMKKIISTLILFNLIFILSCGRTPDKTLNNLSDIKNISIGAMTGSIGEEIAKKRFPDCKVKSFDDIMDAVAALKSKQLDAVITAYPAATHVVRVNKDLKLISEPVDLEKTAIALNKNNKELLNKLNKIILELKEDGTLKSMKERWLKTDDSPYDVIEFKLPTKGKPLRIGTSATREPFCFLDNNRNVTGFDGELARQISIKLNQPIEFIDMKFSALIPALVSGKVDVIIAGMIATNERRKTVDFTEPYFDNSQVIIVAKNPNELKNDEGNFFSSILKKIENSFYNNIIYDNRYLLIFEGLKNTIIISIFSIIFGTLLGSIICFMRMSKRKLLFIPAKIFISLLRGIPILVLLMIIFYVVFASVDIDPILVSIIAFGLNFAAYSSEMFRSGLTAISIGQFEAGVVMGFSKLQTYLFIIIPQAIRLILPVYKGEVITLVKMTSIVGYIAVLDLTKASDIIRSRTFDAFFPLITIAILYFLISYLFILLIGLFEKKEHKIH